MSKKYLILAFLAVLVGGFGCTQGDNPPTTGESETPPISETSPSTTTPSTTDESLVSLSEPNDGERVDERPWFKGKVTDPNATVWVVVHPMEVADYWVQPPATISDDGTWEVQPYIGRPGEVDVGQQYEIMIVANPSSSLTSGEVLKDWPEAQWQSDVITVTRQ